MRCSIELLHSVFQAFSVITFVLTVLSGFVLMAIVCVGYFHVQAHNWTQPPGFFAHGFSGVGIALVNET